MSANLTPFQPPAFDLKASIKTLMRKALMRIMTRFILFYSKVESIERGKFSTSALFKGFFFKLLEVKSHLKKGVV